MEAAAFNMEYWAGHAQDAYYTIELERRVTDSDGDQLHDDWEMHYFGNLGHSADTDEEPDGLTNRQELDAGTDPLDADTDDDGLTDGEEVLTVGTDPLLADTDEDGIADGVDICPLLSDPDPNGFDADCDGDVDAGDYAALAACLTGPGTPPVPACTRFDGDSDDDVDLNDFGVMTTYLEEVPRVYVDQAATGANDGTSWADAYTDLQDALDAAVPGHAIWVAVGTYRPDRGTGDPAAAFRPADGVTVYGGFGGGEVSLAGRNPAANPTILNGDLDGENSYHVLVFENLSEEAVLDGFVITGGRADGPGGDGAGGGVRVTAAKATLRGCVIRGNAASLNGGGIVNQPGSELALVNSVVSGNEAGNRGAGIQNYQATLTATNCTVVNNEAGGEGGGLFINESDVNLANCICWGNTASGGIATNQNAQVYLASGSLDLRYCSVRLWTGSMGGVGNDGLDPMFVDADGPDNIAGTFDDDLRLLAGSGSIDSGDNTADTNVAAAGHQALPLEDAAGGPRFRDDPATPDTGVGSPPIIDRGAYEYVP
jgi:hypothetical protein